MRLFRLYLSKNTVSQSRIAVEDWRTGMLTLFFQWKAKCYPRASSL
jgi:hypothetical protein